MDNGYLNIFTIFVFLSPLGIVASQFFQCDMSWRTWNLLLRTLQSAVDGNVYYRHHKNPRTQTKRQVFYSTVADEDSIEIIFVCDAHWLGADDAWIASITTLPDAWCTKYSRLAAAYHNDRMTPSPPSPMTTAPFVFRKTEGKKRAQCSFCFSFICFCSSKKFAVWLCGEIRYLCNLWYFVCHSGCRSHAHCTPTLLFCRSYLYFGTNILGITGILWHSFVENNQSGVLLLRHPFSFRSTHNTLKTLTQCAVSIVLISAVSAMEENLE